MNLKILAIFEQSIILLTEINLIFTLLSLFKRVAHSGLSSFGTHGKDWMPSQRKKVLPRISFPAGNIKHVFQQTDIFLGHIVSKWR